MTALSADMQRILQSARDIAPISRQILASTTIYDGSAVMAVAASHYARPIVKGATAPQFLGFAQEQVVGVATQAACKTVLIWQAGKLQVPNTTVYFPAGAIATGDGGKPVYMKDDGTWFSLAEEATTELNVGIGKIDNIDLINVVVTIAWESYAMRSI